MASSADTSLEPQAVSSTPTKNATRSSSRRKPSSAEDDESIIRELCTVNGISYDKLHSGVGQAVKQLEIFFFGFPRVVGMRHFPNLTRLCIMNQNIDSMAGLQTCRHLEELWICEGGLSRIEGLELCTNLVRLHLYTNTIGRIEGLDSLLRLEKLWLNGNKIKRIEGLHNLSQLRDLNLAGNEISAIGRSLEAQPDLEMLNLTGNTIASLKDLVHLSSLPKLHTLSFCEPTYPPNPICQLCNYSTYTLYHLPWLKCLDGKDVSSPDLHKLVQGLVSKKKQFYRMKVHHTTQEGRERCKALQLRLRNGQENTYSRMRTLHLQLKMVA